MLLEGQRTHQVLHPVSNLLPVQKKVSFDLSEGVGSDIALEVVEETSQTTLFHKLHDNHRNGPNVVQVVLS